MWARHNKVSFKIASMVLGYLLLAGFSKAGAQSWDELHKAAIKEGGVVNFYATLAQINAERILPVFEKRFPGVKVNHVDATADKLAARAITEARGGRVLSDVFQMALENVLQVIDQKLTVDWLPPEAAAYPSNFKGTNWLAADMVIIIGAWNTKLVKSGDEPKQFEDFADPKWKGKLIAEARDVELLIGLARHKFKNDEKAFDFLRKLAANNIEFHKGHSELAEFLVAGQAAACVTCYAHHYPPRIRKGAPLGYMQGEGIATITANALAKDAPHPNAAKLFYSWSSSEEGQKAYAAGGRLPPHPKVEPREKIRPAVLYPIGVNEIKDWKSYEKVWKEVFKLR
jgi:iron(III) transport system substrate-binding protein